MFSMYFHIFSSVSFCCGFVFSSPSVVSVDLPVATAFMVAFVWLLPFHTFGTMMMLS